MTMNGAAASQALTSSCVAQVSSCINRILGYDSCHFMFGAEKAHELQDEKKVKTPLPSGSYSIIPNALSVEDYKKNHFLVFVETNLRHTNS